MGWKDVPNKFGPAVVHGFIISVIVSLANCRKYSMSSNVQPYIYNQNVCSRGFCANNFDRFAFQERVRLTVIVFECALQIYRNVECTRIIHFFSPSFHLLNVICLFICFTNIYSLSSNADCVRSRRTNSVLFQTTKNNTTINERPFSERLQNNVYRNDYLIYNDTNFFFYRKNDKTFTAEWYNFVRTRRF